MIQSKNNKFLSLPHNSKIFAKGKVVLLVIPIRQPPWPLSKIIHTKTKPFDSHLTMNEFIHNSILFKNIKLLFTKVGGEHVSLKKKVSVTEVKILYILYSLNYWKDTKRHFFQLYLKDVKKSLQSKCLTRTYKKQVILHEL